MLHVCDAYSEMQVPYSTHLRSYHVPLQAANSTDDDWLDYNNELRIGILEAYSGILQGLGPGGCLSLVCGVVQHVAAG